MVMVLAMRCTGKGFKFTSLNSVEPSREPDEESDLAVPANITGRGEQLDWIAASFHDLLARTKPALVYMHRADGAQGDRHEVEGVIRVVGFRHGLEIEMRLPDQVRKALGVPKTAGAFKALLKRADIAARSNEDRRLLYAYALAAVADNEL